MSDLTKYVKARSARDPEFAGDLETGYTDFKVGVLLRQAREKAGLTQEQVAPHFRRFEVIRQSLTWQYQMAQADIRGMRHVLLLQGTTKFGPPDDTARALLTGQTDREHLERMVQSMLVVNTWAELLATP